MSRLCVILFILLFLSACTSRPDATPVGDIPATPLNVPSPTIQAVVQAPTDTNTPPTATATLRPPSPTAIPPTDTALPPTATPVPPTETNTPEPTSTNTPVSTEAVTTGGVCAPPPDDYTRVTLARHTVNRRTYTMLENAQSLYNGRGSMFLLIQGSFTTSTQASFGTHAGGGAVDIWAVDPSNTSVLLEDIDAMVLALRQAGFAAWFRPANMLYQGMSPHIHAIAIGDTELSEEAEAQLVGDEGYFRGRAGLPQEEFRLPDPHNGPILCDWMVAAGYALLPYGEYDSIESSSGDATASLVAECQPPTEDYSRITLDGQTLNRRTYMMLLYAQELYQGPGNLLWITQGGYSDAVDASFGTHAGGGAVDISVRHPSTYEFMEGEAQSMVIALRQAGFAAWYRSPDEGFTPHIHAIAIGDAELSEAAWEQLYGQFGYFNGGNALPDERAGVDKHGGPIVCGWMEGG